MLLKIYYVFSLTALLLVIICMNILSSPTFGGLRSFVDKRQFTLCLERIFQVDNDRLKFNRSTEKIEINCKTQPGQSFFCELSQGQIISKTLSGSYISGINGYMDLAFKSKNGDEIAIKACGIEDRESDDLSSPINCDANIRIKLHSWNGSKWTSYFRAKFCE